MSEIALQEVNRCLGCKSPRCTKACPISMPTNIVFPLLKEGKIEEAGKILFENNPLSLICAYVCPHENQCQGGCVLNAKNEKRMYTTRSILIFIKAFLEMILDRILLFL